MFVTEVMFSDRNRIEFGSKLDWVPRSKSDWDPPAILALTLPAWIPPPHPTSNPNPLRHSLDGLAQSCPDQWGRGAHMLEMGHCNLPKFHALLIEDSIAFMLLAK